MQPTSEAIRTDLALLRRAGFDGLITYGASERFVRETVATAESLGFKGMIIGVWDPVNETELDAAKAASGSPIVLGYCVGNEGYERRYSRSTLSQAIEDLRAATGKPVATSEESDDYLDEEVASLGDWVFPNAHPYFHGRYDPAAAVRWTRGAYDELRRLTSRFVWLKEVGLPTAGDPKNPLSEASQEEYYLSLAETAVLFTFFEAFDQGWKRPGSVEQNWGLFRSDRTAKKLGQRLLAGGPLPRPALRGKDLTPKRPAKEDRGPRPDPFYVYSDSGASRNHFAATGLDGDCGDIQIDAAFAEAPHSGRTCIRIVYETNGSGPNKCRYDPPCKWASLGWRHPPQNKGKASRFAGKGYDLSGYRRLTFWARAETECWIVFFVGGIDEQYGDSLTYHRRIPATLDKEWRKFEIDLRDADLRHIINGFGWMTNWDVNPDGVVFYLDEIRFE